MAARGVQEPRVNPCGNALAALAPRRPQRPTTRKQFLLKCGFKTQIINYTFESVWSSRHSFRYSAMAESDSSAGRYVADRTETATATSLAVTSEYALSKTRSSVVWSLAVHAPPNFEPCVRCQCDSPCAMCRSLPSRVCLLNPSLSTARHRRDVRLASRHRRHLNTKGYFQADTGPAQRRTWPTAAARPRRRRRWPCAARSRRTGRRARARRTPSAGRRSLARRRAA